MIGVGDPTAPNPLTILSPSLSAQLLTAESCLEVMELATRLGPLAHRRLGAVAAYYAVLHQVRRRRLVEGVDWLALEC